MLIIRIVASFLISVAFGVLFGVRGKNLPFAGLAGAVSGGVYLLLAGNGNLTAMLAASAAMGLCCEVLARLRRCPATVFLIAGLIPLVPGGRIYTAMQLALSGQPTEAGLAAYMMLLEAGALALGILLVSSVMQLHRKGRMANFDAGE